MHSVMWVTESRFLTARPMSPRRFPPWSVEELEACFVVIDTSGQKLGYFYFGAFPIRFHPAYPTVLSSNFGSNVQFHAS